MSTYLFKGLAHIGIMTDDPEGCANFYVDNLRFNHYHHVSMNPGPNIWFVENNGCLIEFVKSDKRDIHGIVDHVCFEVQGIDELVSELAAKGIELETPAASEINGLFPCKAKNIFFKGPAGERIEIFDFSQPC